MCSVCVDIENCDEMKPNRKSGLSGSQLGLIVYPKDASPM